MQRADADLLLWRGVFGGMRGGRGIELYCAGEREASAAANGDAHVTDGRWTGVLTEDRKSTIESFRRSGHPTHESTPSSPDLGVPTSAAWARSTVVRGVQKRPLAAVDNTAARGHQPQGS